ncbi:Protein kinase and PP2C-like domain-containing protein [Linum perenne]
MSYNEIHEAVKSIGVEPNSCIRGCCCSDLIYEAILNGTKVAVKKPILSTSEHIDKFHKELQLLCTLNHPGISRVQEESCASHCRKLEIFRQAYWWLS